MSHQIFDKPVIREFADYCESFYGPSGIYPLGCNRADIENAIIAYVKNLVGHESWTWGYGDSVDRERVADILCHRLGLFVYPELQGL